MIRQRLVTGTVSNVVGKATAVGTWFLLTPFILSRLGPHGYALWVLTGSIAAYGFLLDFGIGGAIVKYVAEHGARREHHKAAELVATAQWLYIACGVVAVAVSIVAAPFAVTALHVGAGDYDTSVKLIVLTAMNVASVIAIMPALSVLRGLQRYDLYNLVMIFNSILEAITTITALTAGWGVVGIVAMLVPATLVTGVAAAYLVKRIAPDLSLGWRGARVRAARQIFGFSSSLFAIDVANKMQTKTDEFIIAMLRTVNAVTPYALARKLGDIAELAAVQFLKVIMPLASELDAADQAVKLRTLYIVASRIAMAVAVPIAVILIVIGSTILTLWVGEQYARYGTLLAVMAIGRLVATTQWPASEILLGMARHRFVAMTSIAAGVTHIVLSMLLLPRFGLIGVSVGALVPTVVMALCVVMPFANRTLKISWSTVAREIWIPGLLPGVVAAVVLSLLQQGTAQPSLFVVGGWIVATVVTYFAAYISMPAAEAERQLVCDIFATGTRCFRRLVPDASRLS
jgi:O-antigen/teichoic acid export membrane protein